MAHNNNKLGGSEPNRQGVISPQLNDLNNVNAAAPQSNEVLKYNSTTSAWESAAPSVSAAYLFLGRGEQDDYSNTGNTGSITNGDAWYCYDTSPRNTISGATIIKVSGTHWIDYITLPAGDYTVDAQIFATWTATGYLQVVLHKSTGAGPTWGTAAADRLSNVAYVGAASSAYAVSNVITGAFNISATQVTNNQNHIRLQVHASSNLAGYNGATSQGNIPAEFNYLHLRKLS